ncbi:hypothetical protein JHK87_052943 [Glycine soja]|nr:hypothetical protein JHK87_052943 [Glycine soja]
MGRQIDQQESLKELGKRRRLWLPQDIIQVLKDNTFWVGNEELVNMYEEKLGDAGYHLFKLPQTNNRGDAGACRYESLALDISGGHLAAGVASLFIDGVGCGACFQDTEAKIHCAEWLSIIGGSSTGEQQIRLMRSSFQVLSSMADENGQISTSVFERLVAVAVAGPQVIKHKDFLRVEGEVMTLNVTCCKPPVVKQWSYQGKHKSRNGSLH